MVGWHHSLNGHKFEQTPGDNDRFGSRVSEVPGDLLESSVVQQCGRAQQPMENDGMEAKGSDPVRPRGADPRAGL